VTYITNDVAAGWTPHVTSRLLAKRVTERSEDTSGTSARSGGRQRTQGDNTGAECDACRWSRLGESNPGPSHYKFCVSEFVAVRTPADMGMLRVQDGSAPT
jgi:hypothetical protein